ncbi:hypothetical protein KC219_27290, partial [Mycobacterium tuberculosis]|nr:hypothetical protein [Mycobacterium tuberculosis]
SVKPATKIDQIITLKPVIKNTSIPVNELPATVLPPGDYNTKETAAEKKQALQYGSTSQSLTDTSGTAMMVKPSPDLQKTG